MTVLLHYLSFNHESASVTACHSTFLHYIITWSIAVGHHTMFLQYIITWSMAVGPSFHVFAVQYKMINGSEGRHSMLLHYSTIWSKAMGQSFDVFALQYNIIYGTGGCHSMFLHNLFSNPKESIKISKEWKKLLRQRCISPCDTYLTKILQLLWAFLCSSMDIKNVNLP